MAIDGLTAQQSADGRVVVKYLDVAQVDVSSIVERLFDKALGSSFKRPQNVIPIKKEDPDGPTR